MELANKGGTPPERPPKPRPSQPPQEGDATMAAIGAPADLTAGPATPIGVAWASPKKADDEDGFTPKPVRKRVVKPDEVDWKQLGPTSAAEGVRKDDDARPNVESWVVTLERGNRRLA
jgi:hypothetical protein